jgi:Group II intron, maturase-specific domain
VSEGFSFLGFHIKWTTNSRRGRLLVTIPAERIERFKCEVSKIIRPDVEPSDIVANLHQAISSFGSEFRFVNAGRQFRMLDRWIERKYNEWLTRGGAGNFPSGSESIDEKRVAQPMRLSEIKREPYRPAHRRPFGW